MISLRFHRNDGSPSCTFRVLGWIGTLLVVLLAYLSVDPEAHERVHHHSDGAEHHCVVTSFAAGEAVLLTPALAIRPQAGHFTLAAWPARVRFHATVDLALRPSCGPPQTRRSV